jgi:dihydroorotate dehydrogenase
MRAASRSVRRASRRALAQQASFSSSSKGSSSSLHTAAYLAIGGGAAAAAVAAMNGVVPHEWLIRQLAEPMMPVVRLFDPESAHKIAVLCARFGLTPKDPEPDPELLHVSALGLSFSNPLGIAAGFDKDGEAMEGMLDMGFGCVEIGSVTPQPQPGNPKPRVFRLYEDRGVINRYGFNSKGLDHVGARLETYVGSRAKRTAPGNGHRAGVLGVNLGKNKLTEDAAADYVQGVHALGKYADYLVVNVSSPNTPGLRTLQGKIQLQNLLVRVLKARDEVAAIEKREIPLLVKIAPDLTEDDKQDIADVALDLKLDGLVVSNTTLSRPDSLKGEAKVETGGLSGLPVRDMSTKVLGDMYKLTKGQIPLIGVGGVSTGQDAYDKILAGASLVQMYSCLIYESPLAVPRAKKELAALLRRDGYESVADAIGAAHK